MTAGLGHNGGPTLEAGASWRRHCWDSARGALLPVLPLNVIRRRVARAQELGLDYRTYATVRATTGRDIIGFLFSSNALRMHLEARMPEGRRARLAGLRAVTRIAAMQPPLGIDLAEDLPIDLTLAAPGLADTPRAEREKLLSALRPARLPADGVLVIGATALERGWSANARLAGYLDEARYFHGVA